MLSDSTKKILKTAFVLIVYVAVSLESLQIQQATGVGTQIWPAAGFALACMLIWGTYVWPAMFLGTIIVHFLNGDPFLSHLGSAIGNTVEPLLGAYFCSRDFHKSLDRFYDIVRFIFGAVLVSTFVGTIPAIPTIAAWGSHQVSLAYFIQYWIGDAMGVLLTAPLILVWATPRRTGGFEWRDIGKWEAGAFALSAFAIIVSFSVLEGPASLYFFFPLVLWIALRLGQRGLTLTTASVACVLVWQTANGMGPFAELSPPVVRETYLILFFATLQTTGLVVAGVVMEREIERRSREDLMKASNKDLGRIVQELKVAKEAADMANSAKSAFLATVSHEIRTPLSVVMGFSEELASERTSTADRSKFLETVRKSGQQLSKTIDDILDFAKMETGESSVQLAEVNIPDLLSSIKFMMNLEATKKNLTLTIGSEDNIPEVITTDPLRLRQVLVNIIGNAIKFTDNGTVDVQTKVDTAKYGQDVLAFVITDTGIGISPDKANLLFAPFSQIDTSSTRRYGGIGLGLALSRKLAKALGGDVVLTESSLGKGSVFTVMIKTRHAKQLVKTSAVAQSTPLPTSIQPKIRQLSNKKVLVVDDNPENQTLIKCFLRSTGLQIDTADNGKEAVRKVEDDHFDIVLMDLQMPEMDGYEATQNLRKKGFKKPIIALTAHAMAEVQDRCLASGFNNYMSKPIKRQQLINLLSESVSSAAEKREDNNYKAL
ncbi:MAG: MASE1 domain-containing protein [Oligoflexales bacterium]